MTSIKPKEIKVPKDLGIKLGTKEEAYWTKVKEQSQAAIEESRHNITIHETIVMLAERRITEEKGKV